jgi:hypothetical protein
MCKLTRHGMAEEWHGRCMGMAWHGMAWDGMAWQRNGMDAAWAWYGMCELTRHGMAEERHGRCMGMVWHMLINEAWHGRGRAWTLHGHGMACVN